ncbi:MAG: aminoglycoside N3'-acetyltransferase [Gammaproteobacteria bacterium]
MIKKFIKRFAPRQRRYYEDFIFRRVNERKLAGILESLGVTSGRTLYIQSSFGSLGYYPDGAQRFISLLLELVGPEGTLVMPSFPFGGAMEDYIREEPLFDARHSPSRTGILAEVMRQLPGSRRSCHPSHPVVALGAGAAEIVSGHHRCTSPQGGGSPFDKLVQERALILRINTPAFPLCHRLQEIVEWPNLFLPEPALLSCRDDEGREQQVTTRVYRKKVPFVMYLPDHDNQAVATNIIDFPLLFASRNDRIRAHHRMSGALESSMAFRAEFEVDHPLYSETYNGCVIDSFYADSAMAFAVERAPALLDQYREYYELAQLTDGLATGDIEI